MRQALQRQPQTLLALNRALAATTGSSEPLAAPFTTDVALAFRCCLAIPDTAVGQTTVPPFKTSMTAGARSCAMIFADDPSKPPRENHRVRRGLVQSNDHGRDRGRLLQQVRDDA